MPATATQTAYVVIPPPAHATSVSLLYPKSFWGELSLTLEIDGWQKRLEEPALTAYP